MNAAGIDTVHVGDIGYAAAEDVAILQLGKDQQRVVVTLDADFHTLLALSGVTEPSVIRIRIEGLRAAEVATLLQVVLAQCGEDLAQGAVATIQDGRLRVRRLPLLP